MKKFPIVTFCGSSRFKDDFIKMNQELTLKGFVVISLGIFGHIDNPEIMNTETKIMLDRMHKQKIDMADSIFVIDKDGYIGESTRSEIEYAKSTGKAIYYMSKYFVDGGNENG